MIMESLEEGRMIKPYYGLSFNPFDKTIKVNQHFATKDFSEMTQRLDYLKEIKGFGVFTSPPGQGKTYALRCFSSSLNPSLYKFVYISLTTVSTIEFYRQLADALNLEVCTGKAALYKSIRERLSYLAREKKITVIIAIDECQYLGTDILKDLKLLFNFELDSKDYAAVILAGQPVLNDILAKHIHEALRQRIVIHYQFEGMSAREAKDYVYSRLELAGAGRTLISESALNALYSCCNGSTRQLNSLMTKALMLGAQKEKPEIDTELIMAASNEVALV